MRTITYWLTLLFIFLLPWENVLMVGGGETLSKFLGIGIAGIWLFTVVATKKVRIPLPFHLAVVIFVLWNGASVFWSADPARSYDRAETYAQMAVLIFVLWDIYTERWMVTLAIQCYVLGALITAGSTFNNYLNDIQFYYHRYSATGFNPNDASLIMALGMPLAWHLAFSAPAGRAGLWRKVLNFAYLPIALYAILLTGSRGSLAAAAMTAFYIFNSVLQLRPSLRFAVILAAGLALFGAAIFAPQTSFDRIEARGVELNGRDDVWQQALVVLAEHPIVGIGSAAVKEVIDRQQAAHNFALSISSELGLIGLSFFVIILLLVFYHGWRQDRQYRYFWLTVLLVWLVGASVHNFEHRKQTWVFFNLIVISSTFSAAYAALGAGNQRLQPTSLTGMEKPYNEPDETNMVDQPGLALAHHYHYGHDKLSIATGSPD